MVFLRELGYVFQHLHQLGEEIVSVVFFAVRNLSVVFLRELDYVFQHLHQLGEEIVSVVYCGEKPYCGIFARAR